MLQLLRPLIEIPFEQMLFLVRACINAPYILHGYRLYIFTHRFFIFIPFLYLFILDLNADPPYKRKPAA